MSQLKDFSESDLAHNLRFRPRANAAFIRYGVFKDPIFRFAVLPYNVNTAVPKLQNGTILGAD